MALDKKSDEWGRPELTRKLIRQTPGQALRKVRTLKEGTIKDTLRYSDNLNPALWVTDAFGITTLQPLVREALGKIAWAFREFIGTDGGASVPAKFAHQDVILVGSNANYNWTRFSDVDLHIVMSFDHAESEVWKELFKSRQALWKKTRIATIKGYPVEIYIQDADETLHSGGVYSVSTDRWISQPSHNPPKWDDTAIRSKYDEYVARIEAIIKTPEEGAVREMIEDLKNLRRCGLQSGGEYSTENMVFKALRNAGFIKSLHDELNASIDRKLTLEGWDYTLLG